MRKKIVCYPTVKNGLRPPQEWSNKTGTLIANYWKGYDGVGTRPYILEYEETESDA